MICGTREILFYSSTGRIKKRQITITTMLKEDKMMAQNNSLDKNEIV